MTEVIKASLLSLWLGAALFFSAVVAPAVFGVLRQFALINVNEIAGAIVSRSLSVINLSGFVIGFGVLVVTLLFTRKRNLMFLIQAVLLAVVAAGTAAGHWVVTARMSALRAAMSMPIDRVAFDDPRRVAFDQLHGYSVALLSAAMLAAILFVIVSVVRRRAGSS